MTERRPFVRHIHYFRAIAILFVVISHVFLVPFAKTGFKEPLHGLFFLFFTNATVFFVLISGFLFQYINDNGSFRYGALMKKKFLYIFVPMVAMTIPVMACLIFVVPGSALEKIVGAATLASLWALMGSPLWYIPFIMMVFAVSPLILKFIRLRCSLAITLLVIPVCFFLFPRTLPVWPGVIPYFFPLFVLGAIMSYRYDRFQGLIERNFVYLGCLALIFMVLCALMPPESMKHFNLSIPEGVSSVCSGYFKIFLALFFWGLLIKLENRESSILNQVANYSFGIYFVHCYFLTIGFIAYARLWPSAGGLSFLVTLAYCIIVPLLCLGIAMLIKAVFGRYARYVAGV